jgi:iron complex outermembrane receptor protein
LFTTYEIQSGALKGLGFGGGVYLADRVEINSTNSGNLSGYAQTDLVAYYRRDHWRAQINVKNLFDNEFYYSGNFGDEAVRAAARTVIASVKYEF